MITEISLACLTKVLEQSSVSQCKVNNMQLTAAHIICSAIAMIIGVIACFVSLWFILPLY